MELESAVLERVGNWESLSQWEKSELGKELRRLGLSYGEIMELVPVKKSTLATWCRDIRLTEDQIAAIKKRRPPSLASQEIHSGSGASKSKRFNFRQERKCRIS